MTFYGKHVKLAAHRKFDMLVLNGNMGTTIVNVCSISPFRDSESISVGEKLHCLGMKHCSYYYGTEVQPHAEGCVLKGLCQDLGAVVSLL